MREESQRGAIDIEMSRCDGCGIERPEASDQVRTEWRLRMKRPSGIPASPEVMTAELKVAEITLATYGSPLDFSNPADLPDEVFAACRIGYLSGAVQNPHATREEIQRESAYYGLAMAAMGFGVAELCPECADAYDAEAVPS